VVESSASNFMPFSGFILVYTAVSALDGQPGTGGGVVDSVLSELLFEGRFIIWG